MNEISDPFNIRAHVTNFEEIAQDYVGMSEAARASIRHVTDIAYGPQEDERLDLFFPTDMDGPRPVHMFIHGGYWRANRKENYAFAAESITAAGGIAAIVEYSLMPKVRMAALVDQVRRAAQWLAANIAEHGGDPDRISASGHSAGGHLASYLGARAPQEGKLPKVPIKSLLLISGLYQLQPLTKSFLQAEINLTDQEIARWTPVDQTPMADLSLTLAVGADETEPFHKQAEAYATILTANSVRTRRFVLPGLNHMTVVSDLGHKESALAGLVAQTIAKS